MSNLNKRLLFINHSLSHGGAERVMTLLVNEFCARGYEVDMFVLDAASEEVLCSRQKGQQV